MQTIIALIEQSCKKSHTKPAFYQKTNGAWMNTTYRVLWTEFERITAGLQKMGFQPGDRAALLASSSPQWVMAYLGILKAGGVVVPVDKELKHIELGHILTHSEARVICVDRDNLETVLVMAESLPSLESIVVLEAAPVEPAISGDVQRRGARITSLAEMCADSAPLPVVLRPEDTALILYTSGTTGRSKGAMLSHANIASNIRGTVEHLNVDDSVHTLSFLPINHVFEQVCGILLPLSLGGKVTFCESLKKLADNIAEVKPTFLVGVPAFYRMFLGRIMKKIEEDAVSRFLYSFPLTRPLVTAKVRKKIGSGTIFVSGGAALDPEIATGFATLGLMIVQGYGITETSPVIAAESPGRGRLGTVGRVLPGVEVAINRSDNGKVGEILVKGPNVMQGYFKDPAATAVVLINGWYHTGDLGHLDADGFLTICGRAKNLIVTANGRNVYPEEVENEILKSPYVAEVLVYPHKTGPVTEEIHAMIFPNREALEEYSTKQEKQTLTDGEVELLLKDEVSQCCGALAAYKRVKKISVRWEEFPKTTTRKIKRFEVGITPETTAGSPGK